VAVDPEYAEGLSQASVRSLEVQGGPMSPEEIERFTGLPHYATAIELRRWDDLGKVRGTEVPTLEQWRPTVVAALREAPQ
jgi:predicted HD phosphohydrolase